MEKYKLATLIRKSTRIYHENFKALMTMELVTLFVAVLMQITRDPERFGINLYKSASMLLLIVFFPLLYFSIRLSIAQVKFTKNAIDKSTLSISSCYKEAKDATWRVLGFNFFAGVIVLIYFMVIILSAIRLLGMRSPVSNYIVIFVSSLPLSYMYVRLYFVKYIAALNYEGAGLIEHSWEITKKHQLKTFLLILIPGLIYFAIFAVPLFFVLTTSFGSGFYPNNTIIYVVYAVLIIVQAFLQPLVVLVSVHAMNEMDTYHQASRNTEIVDRI